MVERFARRVAVSGRTRHRTRPASAPRRRRGALAAALAAVMLASGLSGVVLTAAPAATAATTQGCGYADGSPNNGRYAGAICWFDFSSFDEEAARSAAGQPMSLTLSGGYTATFTVKVTDVPGTNRMSIRPRETPVESRFAFGTDAYRRVPGSPVLYSQAAPGGTKGGKISFSDITVVDSSGTSMTGYSFVAVDAEDNVSGELFWWSSDQPITEIERLAPDGGWGCKSPTGLGTTTVACAGTGSGSTTTEGGKSTALLVAANTPSTFSTQWQTAAQSGIAIGIQTARLTLNTTVAGRVAPGDSFAVAIDSPEGTTVGTASTGTANTATTGSISVLPRVGGSGAFTLRETAEGSSSPLSGYDQAWMCTNATAGSATVLPSGAGTTKTVTPSIGDDISCTVTNTPVPVPMLSAWKSVVASEWPLRPGSTLAYTLHFANTGTAPAPVHKVDDLTQGIDDATVTAQPVASSGDLQTTAFGGDHRSHITGAVPAGTTVTVAYTLTVKPSGQLGDGVVANFLQNPSDAPPTSPACAPADPRQPDCTVSRVGDLQVSMSVEPATGTIVFSGDALRYTLWFENVGGGPVAVDHTDHLAKVLDDAVLTSHPVASDAALAVSAVTDGTFAVTSRLVENPVRFLPRLVRSTGATYRWMGAVAAVGALAAVAVFGGASAAARSERVAPWAAVYQQGAPKSCEIPRTASGVAYCVGGAADAARSVMVVGDSHAAQWVPTLSALGRAGDFRVLVRSLNACPAAVVSVTSRGTTPLAACDEFHRGTEALLSELRPDVVLIANSNSYLPKIIAPSGTEAEAWRLGYARLVDAAQAAGARVVAIEDTHRPGSDPAVCVTRPAGSVEACTPGRERALAEVRTLMEAEREVQAASGVPAFRPVEDLCGPEVCAILADGVPVFADLSHVSPAWVARQSTVISSLIASALEREDGAGAAAGAGAAGQAGAVRVLLSPRRLSPGRRSGRSRSRRSRSPGSTGARPAGADASPRAGGRRGRWTVRWPPARWR